MKIKGRLSGKLYNLTFSLDFSGKFKFLAFSPRIS